VSKNSTKLAEPIVRSGVVDFEDVNKINKKSVRGLLRKRAKKYDSDDNELDSDGSAENVQKSMTDKKKKTVQKKSMAEAFQAIMNKKDKTFINEDNEEQQDDDHVPILSKYKKPER